MRLIRNALLLLTLLKVNMLWKVWSDIFAITIAVFTSISQSGRISTCW